MSSASPKLLNLNQEHPSKDFYTIEVITTCLIEMLELQNFGQVTTSTRQLGSIEKNVVVDVKDKNYGVITFVAKYLYVKKRKHQSCNHV